MVVLKEGWLNRQMDQVSKNVDNWPDWMKRAGGFENESKFTSPASSTCKPELRAEEKGDEGQRALDLKL